MWIVQICGLLLIMFTLRETFRDLFQPSGSGSLSAFVGRRIFSLAKRYRSLVQPAGALAVLLTITSWTCLVALGFALLYWPGMPESFKLPEGERTDLLSRFGLALYFSFEALATLGQGDVTAKVAWIRMLSITEALLGFSLLTASISWIVLIYPALGRMRTLARFAADLKDAEERTGIDLLTGDAEELVGGLTQDLIRTRVDFIHFPLIYYFYAGSDRAALPEAVAHLLDVAETGCSEQRSDRVRLAAATLRSALEDFARVLARRFLKLRPGRPACRIRGLPPRSCRERSQLITARIHRQAKPGERSIARAATLPRPSPGE